jgi:hypothetical protein
MKMLRYGLPRHGLNVRHSHTSQKALLRFTAACQSANQDIIRPSAGPPYVGFSSRLLRASESRLAAGSLTVLCGGHYERVGVSSHNIVGASCRSRSLTTAPPTGGSSSRGLNMAARLVEAAPAGLQPYLKLVRLDKPVGKELVAAASFFLCFWP